MLGGVTRHMLPHLPGVPHFHVKNEKGTGAEMRPAIVSGIVPDNALVSYWSIFSLSLLTVPEVFVKVNSAQSPSCFLSGELAMLRLYVRLGSCFYCTKQFKIPRGRRQRERQKSYSLTRQNNNFCTCHAFLYWFLYPASLHDYDVKLPNFTSYGRRKQATTKFSLNLDMVVRNSVPGEFAYIWPSKRVGIITIEI